MGLLDALQDSQFRQDVRRGLLDAGNRGIVGGLLGAPVDLLPWLGAGALGAAWAGQGLLGERP